MNTINFKNLISNNDVVQLLEDIGFNEIEKAESEGYILKRNYNSRVKQDIEVYLEGGYINIHLAIVYITIDIYEVIKETYIYGETSNISKSYYCYKTLKIEKGNLDELRNFLLISICRGSFLDPSEEIKAKSDLNSIRHFSDWYV